MFFRMGDKVQTPDYVGLVMGETEEEPSRIIVREKIPGQLMSSGRLEYFSSDDLLLIGTTCGECKGYIQLMGTVPKTWRHVSPKARATCIQEDLPGEIKTDRLPPRINTINELANYFSTLDKPVTLDEMYEFWESLSLPQKAHYIFADLTD